MALLFFLLQVTYHYFLCINALLVTCSQASVLLEQTMVSLHVKALMQCSLLSVIVVICRFLGCSMHKKRETDVRNHASSVWMYSTCCQLWRFNSKLTMHAVTLKPLCAYSTESKNVWYGKVSWKIYGWHLPRIETLWFLHIFFYFHLCLCTLLPRPIVVDASRSHSYTVRGWHI